MAVLILAPVAVQRSAAQAACVGDCNGDGMVVISELLTGVNIVLEYASVTACEAFADNGGAVTVSQLVQGVNNALGGCGATPTPAPGCHADADCTNAQYPNCGPDGNCWSQPCSDVCSGGQNCCGGAYPYCGPDLNCWSLPCSTICTGGQSCCGGDFPYCGPDARCWNAPCVTLCGDTCCGPSQTCQKNMMCSH